MIGLLLWPALGLVCLCLALSYPLVLRPQLDHRRHSRTLANIARLERELGYDTTIDTVQVGNYAYPVRGYTPWTALVEAKAFNWRLTLYKPKSDPQPKQFKPTSSDYTQAYLDELRRRD